MKWLSDGEESRAPDPTDEIFSVSFDPCPPDVGPLPPHIAEAAAAAIGILGTASTHASVVKTILPGRQATEQRQIFLMFWWVLVGEYSPARDSIHRVARYLNKGGPLVEAMGMTAPSAHHIALEYALWHTRAVWRTAAVVADPTNSGLWELDPVEVCRDPSAMNPNAIGGPPNQIIQDTLLGQFELVRSLHKKRKIPTDTDRLEALILTEARNAADAYESDPLAGIEYRAVIAKDWVKDTPVAWVDGRPQPLSFAQWKLLRAMSNARPNGLSKDELETVNSNARRMLYELQEDAAWGEVIVFPEAKGQGGYRLY